MIMLKNRRGVPRTSKWKKVDTPYCPNCLENMPSAEAKLKKNRCSNCFDCPSCGHTLTTRATSTSVPDPEDPNKTTPKKMYYMVCGFCRWTTRDVGIQDKPVASGGWEDLENKDTKQIFSLLETYEKIAQKEKAEKERKKYVRRRSYLSYAAGMDKYGMVSVAAKRKQGNLANLSIKENEEVSFSMVKPSETVKTFDPLPESIFTEPIQLDKMSTISQRHASADFQPGESSALYPLHKHLLIRRSLRCKECEHNLSKPEFNPISIKFKIQLIALHHIPEIKIFSLPELILKKECKVVLTLTNPSAYNCSISFLQPDPKEDNFSNAKVELPKHPIVVAQRDDAALYDDGSQGHEAFKDDPSVIAYRKSNKVGFFMKVKPQNPDEDVKLSFLLKHEYRNTAIALPSENQEPQIASLQHQVFINLGPPKKK